MKIFLLINIQLLALCSSIFCQQCPPSAMKIQSPICDTPKNLRANSINCSTVNLTWQGNNKQEYIVQAAGTDNAENILFEAKSAKYNCNESSNCAVTISVQQGAVLNWNVQAICNINGVTIYSPVIQAKQTTYLIAMQWQKTQKQILLIKISVFIQTHLQDC